MDSQGNKRHNDPGIAIPPPLLVIIEDVGWWSGFDGSRDNEPFRTGMNRMHTPDDYDALVTLSRSLGAQILAGLVLCEWDKHGLLCRQPDTTWLGERWKAPPIPDQDLQKAASILNSHQSHVAVAMHGVGHEYWDKGRCCRSEFHDDTGSMRDKTKVACHMALFAGLFETSGFCMPRPRVFIPPALRHSFGNGDQGFQKILAGIGCACVVTVFEKSRQYSPPLFETVTEECGVTLIERGRSPVAWNEVAAEPRFSFDCPVLPLHWANILHSDPAQNRTVASSWGRFVKKGARERGYLLLPDALEALSQIVFSTLGQLRPVYGGLHLDISRAQRVLAPGLPACFYMNLPEHVRADGAASLAPARHLGPAVTKVIPHSTSGNITLRL